MLNNIIAGAAFYYLYWVVIKKHQSFSFTIEKADEIELSKRQLIMTVSFTMVFILSFFTTLQNAIYGMMPFAVLQFYYKYLKGKSKDTKSKMRAGIQVKE